MNKGFTLIELMITIAIIGILALMAYPTYQNYMLKVRLAKLAYTIDINLVTPLSRAFASGLSEELDDDAGCIARIAAVEAEIAEFKASYKQPEYVDLNCYSQDDYKSIDNIPTSYPVAQLYFYDWEYVSAIHSNWVIEFLAPSIDSPITLYNQATYDDLSTGENSSIDQRTLSNGSKLCAISTYAGLHMLPLTNIGNILPKQCKNIYTNSGLEYTTF